MAARLSTAELLSFDAAALQKRLNSGILSSVDLVNACLEQISKHDQKGAKLNAMISIVPHQALMERSAQLDRERATGRVRSLFHGIPILVKDAIATGPSLEVPTTLGSLAFKASVSPRNAKIIEKLESLGVIILGKTNLNEFCDFKGDANSNGWSAVGGQTQSAYLAHKTDETGLGQTDPCGSSTGSAVGVSAGYAPIALGTESIGSIVMPSMRAGLYGFKPALGVVDMDGVFRSSVELDVVGGIARSTADLALLTQTALTDQQQALLPEDGYQKFLTKTFDGLQIGFLDPTKWSLHPSIVQLDNIILEQMNEMYFAAIKRIQDQPGALVAYPVDIPPATDMWYEGENPINIVFSYEGKQALEDWMAFVKIPGLKTIEDIIKFNLDNKEQELPKDHPDQNQLLKASRDPPSRSTCEAVKEHMKSVSKVNGIDKLFQERDLNLLAFPLDSLMVFISAGSGYPIATMPLGVLKADGRPYGLGIMAQAGREDLMFKFMSAFEAHSPPRVLPAHVLEDSGHSL